MHNNILYIIRLLKFAYKDYISGIFHSIHYIFLCTFSIQAVEYYAQKHHLSEAEAFDHSNTYQALQNTENTLWAESAGYIADRFYEEQEQK